MHGFVILNLSRLIHIRRRRQCMDGRAIQSTEAEGLHRGWMELELCSISVELVIAGLFPTIEWSTETSGIQDLNVANV